MSEIDTNVLRNGQLAVATIEQEGTIISTNGEIDTTALVQTDNGKQLCVKTFKLGEGGGGGGSTDVEEMVETGAIIAKSFASNKYLKTAEDLDFTAGPYEIELHFKTGASWDDYEGIFANFTGVTPGLVIGLQNAGKLYAYANSGANLNKDNVFSLNTEYWVKLVSKADYSAELYIKTPGNEYELAVSGQGTAPSGKGKYVFGAMPSWSPVRDFNGELYLSDCTVKINGVVVLDGKNYATQLTNEGGVTIENTTGSTILLKSNTIFNGGSLANLTVSLPNTVAKDFVCQVNFSSGATPTTFTAPAGLYFNGDACASGVFTPEANHRYCFLVISDGVNVLAFVYQK